MCLKMIPSFLMCLTVFTVHAADWPRWGGPDQNLAVRAEVDFESAAALELTLLWQTKFGSGYPAVLMADGKLISSAATADGDAVAAFDPANGKQLWKTVIAPVWLARNGSDDGPIATPTIADGRVYQFHPSGVLACLSLSNGKEIWRRDLAGDFDGQMPGYGFSGVPLVIGETVVTVIGGTDKRTVTGLKANTGETLWQNGIDDQIGYQNPVHMKLRGHEQVVVASNNNLFSIDPRDGKLMWQHKLEARDSSSILVPIDETGFLLKGYRDTARFTLSEDGQTLSESWRKNVLKSNHCQPIYHNGYLYGFDGQFISCVNPTDGKLVWKSRPPGGEVVAMVDDVLLMPDRKGRLTAARASSEGYQELGTLKLSKDPRIFTPPVFANGRVYLRDLENIYAINVRPVKTSQTNVANANNVPSDEAGKFIRGLAKANNKVAAIDAFLKEHPQNPVITDAGYAHFFYRGDKKDVAIVGDMTGKFSEESLQQIAGTDLFHRAYPMASGQRWEYRFREFEDNLDDPRNQTVIDSPRGQWNVAVRGDWQEPGWLTASEPSTKGRLEAITVKDPNNDREYNFDVYLPASYDRRPNHAFPVAVFTHGDQAQKFGEIVKLFDHGSGKDFDDVVAVFLKLPDNAFYGRSLDRFIEIMTELILPKLNADFRVSKEPAHRVVVAQEWHTRTAAILAFRHPDLFGNLALQSPFIGELEINRDLAPLMKNTNQRVYLERSAVDAYYHPWSADARAAIPQFKKVLKEAGQPVTIRERADGYGWTAWRKAIPTMLSTIFPKDR